MSASSAASMKLNRAVSSRMPPRNHPAAPEASKARITPTEAGELAYQLQHVVEKLKPSTS